ncbi:MAG: hypothetical protein GVY10_09885 [Verrucomicrobia bacterium]|jgi:hypothetical protein|nr:hypothetical protein [Verrucomicrobiota bacterium]
MPKLLARHPFCGLFLLCFGTWIVFSWPAMTTAWWFQDDFNMYDPMFSFWDALIGGWHNARLLLGPAHLPMRMDAPPETNGINLLLRFFQAGLHAWVGTLIAFLLHRRVPVLGAMACGWLFVTWGYHAQASLWWSANIYVYGALFSLMGTWAVLRGTETGRSRLCWLGVLGLFASMHTNQAVALAGPMIFAMLVVLEWLEEGRFDGPIALKRGAWQAGALVAGLAVSLLQMRIGGVDRVYDKPIAERLQFVTEQILNFLYRLDLYNGFLPAGHFLVLGLGMVALILGRKRPGYKALPLLTGLFLPVVLALAAVAALFASGSVWPSFRVMYLMPLVLTGSLALAFHAGRHWPFLCRAALAVALLTGLASFPHARQNARDLVALYRNDVRVLEKLQAFADEHGTDRVLIMDWQRSRPWQWYPNAYQLASHYGDNVRSILQTEWSNYRVIWYYTDLEHVPHDQWEPLREKYADLARNLPHDQPFRFHYVEEEDFVLFVPR